MYRFIFMTMALMLFLMFGCSEDNSTEPTPVSLADFTLTIENIALAKSYLSSGIFNTPTGGSSPAPIGPGEAYEFTFDAVPGNKLSFATMFVHSNDFFYAPDQNGIELFNGTMQVTGDITAQIKLWDSGTEINQEPGLGSDQAPRQSGANTGAADPTNTVREAPDTFNNLPAVSAVLKVTLSSTSATGFMARIENVSTATTLMTSDGNSAAVPLAPGVFVIHSGNNPLFNDGMADAGNGLEALAEDGDPSDLFAYLAMDTGVTQVLAPGIWAVHSSDDILFAAGQMDMGEGLEALAEDGDPSVLASALGTKTGVRSSGVFNTPQGASSPAPAGPGNIYEFNFSAQDGDKLSFATMFVQSNDLFYAPDGMGIDLFDASGNTVTGEITSQIYLWDAGTEQNEMPGVGLNQAPRQEAANTGLDENGIVQLVNDGFQYPLVQEVIKITLSKQ